ncbi:MAG: DUF6504 family protein [Chloroflexota bacterium]
MNYSPLHFIEEPIEPVFEREPALEKTPPCPQAFRWREQVYTICELLSEWHDYTRRGKMARNMQPQHAAAAARRGSWGVGIFYFRVRVESGQVFDIYYDRAPQSVDERKGAWFIYREMAAGDATAEKAVS